MKKYDAKEKQDCLICQKEFDSNKDGSFSRHLKKEHQLQIRQYLKKYIFSIEELKCNKKTCDNLVEINDKNQPKSYCEECLSKKNFKRKSKNRICPVCDKEFENVDLRVKTCSFECGRKATSKKVENWHSNMSTEEKKERFNRIITKTAVTRKNNGTPSWNSGKTGIYSEETIEKIRQATLRQMEKQVFGKTSIELKMEEILTRLNIRHKYSKVMWGRQYDFILWDYNILIECDGDYWHGNPKFYPNPDNNQKKKQTNDRHKEKLAQENGYKVIRFWEDEIHNETERVRKEIALYVGLIATT